MGLDFEIPSRASSAKVFISFQFAPFNPWLWFSREEACEEQSENFVNKKSCCFSREHFFFFFFHSTMVSVKLLSLFWARENVSGLVFALGQLK